MNLFDKQIKENDKFAEGKCFFKPFVNFGFNLISYKNESKFVAIFKDKESFIFKSIFLDELVLPNWLIIKEFQNFEEYNSWKEIVQKIIYERQEQIANNWFIKEFDETLSDINNRIKTEIEEKEKDKLTFFQSFSFLSSHKDDISKMYEILTKDDNKSRVYKEVVKIHIEAFKTAVKEFVETHWYYSKNNIYPKINAYEMTLLLNKITKVDRKDLYKTKEILKKNWKKRQIFIPNDEIIAIQRSSMKFMNLFEPSDYSYWFRKGYSCKDNAKVHIWQNLFIKLDIKDFFSNITLNHIFELLHIEYKFTLDFSLFLSLLFTCPINWFRLSTWAPISPIISNLVFSKVDDVIIEFLKEQSFELFWNKNKIKFSRYVDDMTLSFPEKIDETTIKYIIDSINKILVNNKYKLNEEKTEIINLWKRIKITGVTINSWEATIERKKRTELKMILFQLEKALEEIKLTWWNSLLKKVIFKTLIQGKKIKKGFILDFINHLNFDTNRLNKEVFNLFMKYLSWNILYINSVNVKHWSVLLSKFKELEKEFEHISKFCNIFMNLSIEETKLLVNIKKQLEQDIKSHNPMFWNHTKNSWEFDPNEIPF